MASKTEKLEKPETIEKTEKLEKIEKIETTAKPANLRANAMPSSGYVLAIDGKLKTRFDTSEAAMTAGLKLKQDYPVIQIAVFDAVARSYTPVALPEK